MRYFFNRTEIYPVYVLFDSEDGLGYKDSYCDLTEEEMQRFQRAEAEFKAVQELIRERATRVE